MSILDTDFQLEKKRNDAKITQVEMATILGVSQSQVSRYEQDPDNVPAGILRKWNQICGAMAGVKGLEIDDPRLELKSRINLMTNYASVEPDRGSIPEEKLPVTAAEFLASVKIIARKSRVGVFGQFDAGKSRLLNTLLGGNRLPTNYQPATSVVCLLRHMNDKPEWQAEDVWLMGKGFNLDMADDKDHCLKHKMFAGGYESLSQYGTHTGTGRDKKAFAATVYVDSPLLLGADLVDLPGYGHSDDDKDRAEMAQKTVDVLIYAAAATGFMNQNDLTYLSVLIRNLPVFKDSNGNVAPVRNMFIVATHAHHVNQPDERKSILDSASERSYKHLDNAIADHLQQLATPITLNDFQNRFFTFSADDVNIRDAFEKDLKTLLSDAMPASALYQLQKHVLLAKSEASSRCERRIAALNIARDEKAKGELKVIKEVEPRRLKNKESREQTINERIDEFAKESNTLIGKIFKDLANVAEIETMLRNRYDDNKKEALQLGATHLIDSIQKSTNDGVRVMSDNLGHNIDAFLDKYCPAIDESSLGTGGWDFNARAAFMSALSGGRKIGALAAWARNAAGDDLAGASCGLPIGQLSAINILACTPGGFIGGALILGLAAAFAVGGAVGAVGFAVFSALGDLWPTKLAKKIHEGLNKQEAERKMCNGVAAYWADTKKAFEIAVTATEENYQSRLKSLDILFASEPEEIEAELKLAKETRDFFAGMPWRVMQSEKQLTRDL